MDSAEVYKLFKDYLSDFAAQSVFADDKIILSNIVDGDCLTVRISVPSDKRTATLEFFWDDIYNAFVAHCDYLTAKHILNDVVYIKVFLLGGGYGCNWPQIIKNARVKTDEIPSV